jgi:hypothetical protein
VSIGPLPEGRLRATTRDGSRVVQLQCPACGCWGDIDDEQLHGTVSVDHTDCTGPGPRGMETAHPVHVPRDPRLVAVGAVGLEHAPAEGPVSLDAVRRSRDLAVNRARMAEHLRGMAAQIEREELECDPERFLIVMVGADSAGVSWRGQSTWDELQDAASALSAAVWAASHGRPIQAAAAERIDFARRARARRAEDEAAHRVEFPWGCEWCDERYKTQRVAETHERKCRRHSDSEAVAPPS